MSFIRSELSQLKIFSASQPQSAKHGDQVKVAGLILVRQRPGTASGVCFITLEGETGTMNPVVFRGKLLEDILRQNFHHIILIISADRNAVFSDFHVCG